MRIIKKRSVKFKKLRWECSKCRSTIESTEEEGQLQHDNRDGDAIVSTCPVCKHDNWIDRSLFKI